MFVSQFLINLNKYKMNSRKNKFIIYLIIIFGSLNITAQNTAERIIANNEGLHIGGYGQIDMNLQSEDNTHYNSKLDVHRLVTFLGYNFNDKVSFVSEIEYEHVVEVYVEQAFMNYKLKDNMSIQAGLMLIQWESKIFIMSHLLIMVWKEQM